MRDSQSHFEPVRVAYCVLRIALLLLLPVGCSHEKNNDVGPFFVGSVSTPQPPPFLNGASSVLLTNLPGFSARVTMIPGLTANEPVSGQLLGRGSKLVFAPDPGKSAGKKAHQSAVTFLWDVSQNSGYVLSESLQAYAPWSSNVRFTNIVETSGASAPERVNGQTCQEKRVTVESTAAYNSSFSVWRAADLQGFPVQISSATNPATLKIDFTKVRPEPPPAELFTLPDGFTKYPSAEAMMTELVMRQQNLKRRVSGDWTPTEPSAPAGPEGYRTPTR